MPVAVDLLRLVAAALPVAGVGAVVLGAAVLVLALWRRGRSWSSDLGGIMQLLWAACRPYREK